MDPGQLDLGADLWVVGNAVSRGNPLLEAILDRGLSYTSGPQWLAEHILPGKWVLAVAGTHGKTTTSSLLAWLLEGRGSESRFLVGRRAAGLRCFGAADRFAFLRHRSRRVRHRVLRQALEVRPLPAADRDP